MLTKSANASTVVKKWVVVDARRAVVGRLAAYVATVLRGKNKPYFTPHVDCGDNVIIINADKIEFSGNKWRDKTYFWHTGYPGGIKSRKAHEIRDGKKPEDVIRQAIKRMMPGGPLSRTQLKNLRVYTGEDHPHVGQQPTIVNFGEKNSSNLRGFESE